MTERHYIPYRGEHMLRFDREVIGSYEAMPIMLWLPSKDFAGVATPMGVYPFEFEAVLDYTQRVHDIENQRTFDSVSQWLRFKEEGEPVGRTHAGGTVVTPSLRELGISGRAVVPLSRIGVVVLSDLQKVTRETVAGTKGVSEDTLAQLIALMTRYKLPWLGDAALAQGADDDGDEDDIM